ncbi:MAG: carboxylesterase family protein [Chloroflexota bacterium]
MSNPTVVIKSGRLEGLTKKGVHIFKGIPYAKPPVGNLRWRPPQPVDKWTGTFKAHKFGAIAMQRQMEMADFVHNLVRGQGFGRVKQWAFLTVMKLLRLNESEDCLWLNVRTPDLKPDEKLPVMVFIHGGAHQDGGSHEPLYDGNALPQKDVVLVTINYRLGLFGFMAHPDLSTESEHGVSGNYGMLDQILALKWVRENIAQFGGDRNNVTIFGESAGGESVIQLYCSPEAHGLFHKAIAQSPASGGQFSFLKKPFKWHKSSEQYGIDFANRAGATGPNQVQQLRKMTAEELQKIVKEGYASAGNFYPVVDGPYQPKPTF